MPDGNVRRLAPIEDARRWWVLVEVVAAQFMFVVDAFIVNVALPSIAADLKAGSGEREYRHAHGSIYRVSSCC